MCLVPVRRAESAPTNWTARRCCTTRPSPPCTISTHRYFIRSQCDGRGPSANSGPGRRRVRYEGVRSGLCEAWSAAAGEPRERTVDRLGAVAGRHDRRFHPVVSPLKPAACSTADGRPRRGPHYRIRARAGELYSTCGDFRRFPRVYEPFSVRAASTAFARGLSPGPALAQLYYHIHTNGRSSAS